MYDFHLAEKRAIDWTWDQYKIPKTEETLKCFHKCNVIAWELIEKGKLSIEEMKTARFQWMVDELNLIIDIPKIAKDYLDYIAKTGEMLPYSLDVISELRNRGYPIYIITNGLTDIQSSRFHKEISKGMYEKMYCGEDIGFNKPHPLFFERVLNDIGISEDEKDKVVVIGDSLSSDICGGINAGLDTIWFNQKKASQDTIVQPTYEIHDLRQLLEFFPSCPK